MKPLIYGYLRAPDDVSDDDLDRAVDQMRRFADAEGYCYATTFFEHQEGSRTVFDELIEELMRVEARHVVVPFLEHLSRHRILRNYLVERLELCADACVLTPGSGEQT
ncbi:MAG TPA: recombinase family protein [Pseudonocardiaceae bacterium]